MEVWLESVPHWLVPAWPRSDVFGAVLGRYVALYVCAPASNGRTAKATETESILEGNGGQRGMDGVSGTNLKVKRVTIYPVEGPVPSLLHVRGRQKVSSGATQREGKTHRKVSPFGLS